MASSSLLLAASLLLLSSASFSLHPSALFAAKAASTSSSSITADCMSILTVLVPCQSALSSSAAAPDATCCDPLQSVLTNTTKFNCLCSILGNPTYTTIVQSALKLPTECKLSIVATQDNCTTSTSTSTGTTPSTSSTSTGSSSTPSTPTMSMDSNSAIAAFFSSSLPLLALFIVVAFLM